MSFSHALPASESVKANQARPRNRSYCSPRCPSTRLHIKKGINYRISQNELLYRQCVKAIGLPTAPPSRRLQHHLHPFFSFSTTNTAPLRSLSSSSLLETDDESTEGTEACNASKPLSPSPLSIPLPLSEHRQPYTSRYATPPLFRNSCRLPLQNISPSTGISPTERNISPSTGISPTERVDSTIPNLTSFGPMPSFVKTDKSSSSLPSPFYFPSNSLTQHPLHALPSPTPLSYTFPSSSPPLPEKQNRHPSPSCQSRSEQAFALPHEKTNGVQGSLPATSSLYFFSSSKGMETPSKYVLKTRLPASKNVFQLPSSTSDTERPTPLFLLAKDKLRELERTSFFQPTALETSLSTRELSLKNHVEMESSYLRTLEEHEKELEQLFAEKATLTEEPVYDRKKDKAKADWFKRFEKPFKFLQKRPKNSCIDDAELQKGKVLLELHGKDVYIDKFNITIKREHLQCLLPHGWLNDEIINFYMSMLQERNSLQVKVDDSALKCWLFNTFFFQKMMNDNNEGTYSYDAVKEFDPDRWTRRKKVDIFSMDMIIVPINISQSHWILGIVDMRKSHRCISLYDSLHGTNERWFTTIRNYLQDEHLDKKGIPLKNIEDWKYPSNFTSEKGTPSQENTYDCGVFLCQTAECLSANRRIDFQQSDIPNMRVKMALQIVDGYL
ncbi:Ulp1 protease family, C-terminal catalytic domain-containing protein [Cardiosporidium cionae]|uniref:Ulp1 protease family, C-terminal catalytic domain-containing protein n=1 Tax=Cardiosporidium cionae TaxID=476202 RepID=A0ABQ7JG77_9APIC|nr:Ulp1 protease family, C-terminal catalytic domain-containing protein [Cardiosporidium cionae]|eukprot:KAF8822934.1 Ulp1 protease family, C-terminal catalytic domain-containing protein [Cardiosporidium cionae]